MAPTSNGHASHTNGKSLNGVRSHTLQSVAGGLDRPAGYTRGGRGDSWARVPAQLAITRTEGAYLRFGKRLFDILGASLGLLIGAPVLALAAIAIKLESHGPVLYKSTRIGRGGRPFTFVKLRSMVIDADSKRHDLKHLNQADGPVFKIFADPRMTRVGPLAAQHQRR